MIATLLAAALAFRPEALAPGVHLLRPAEGDRSRTNALVVERRDGLLVAGAQPDPQAARDLLAAVRTVSAKPVRYLVLLHVHTDASGGASAFPAEALTVSTPEARDFLADPSSDPGGEVRAAAPDPAAWTEPPRPVPVLLIQGPTTLDDPDHPVDLLPVPGGHAPGDVVVVLPRDGVAAIGSYHAPDRNYFARDGNVGGWLATLSNLVALPVSRFVPLHGPPVDARALRATREDLAWVRGQVEEAFIDRVPRPEIADRVLALPAAAERTGLAARPSFARSLVEQVIRETEAERNRRKPGR